jgi:hypothetical protein
MRLQSIKWLLAIGLAAGGVKVCQSHLGLHQWLRRHQFRVEGLDQALPSQVYFLETNRWLTFDIPHDTPLVRLISNASISPTQPAIPGNQWPYAIEYQLAGKQGQTVASGIYHFRAEQLVFLDKQSGNTVEVNSYLDRRFSPLGGRRCILNLKDPAITNAQLLRVRLRSSHPDLLEVAVRIYFETQVPERKIGYLWNRLSEDQKRDLARGNVYSIEGLTEREKQGLLRYRWSVAAPEGIPGRDFQNRILYIRDDSENLQRSMAWTPSGMAVDSEHRGVLPITNAPGVGQVQLLDFTSTSAAQVVSNTLSWYGGRQRIETRELTWSGTNQTVLSSNREGFLEISSSRPVYVRAFQVEAGRTNEITPEPVQLLTFAASPTNSMEYAVDHAGEEPTLFRVDVRRVPPAGDGTTRASDVVHYALLASNGVVVQEADVALTNTFSAYDWLVTTNGLTNITVPQSLCFVLPPEIRALRIVCPSGTLFVNAYSRPFQLLKKLLVPEDYSPGRKLNPEQPNWFTVRPVDHRQRLEDLQYRLVRVQARPPEYDPLVQAGQYEWESFLPGPESRGQMILLPPAEDLPPRPESLPFSYFPVRVGTEKQVRFQGEPWERQVAPSLMLMAGGGPPGSATVTVDGQTVLAGPLEAPVTQVRLGNLAVGGHKLSVLASSPVSAYLNYLASDTNAAYLQRFCVMASSNVLHFPYVKRQASEEVLVLRIFSPLETNPQPFAVHLRLKPGVNRGIGPFAELTLLEREALVTPNPVGRTRLVAATPAQLDDGQPVFLRVGSDVPPGEHEIEVAMATSSPRWLSLSRTTPGLAEKQEFNLKRRVD